MYKINVYSDVVNCGLILPKKVKYTMRDVSKIMTDSLFKPLEGVTIDLVTAVFIVKCSAVFHDTSWSEGVSKANNRKYKIG